jgi:hypothetical protein
MVFAGLALMFAGMAAGALWIILAAVDGTGPYQNRAETAAARSAVGVTAIVLLAAGTIIAALAAVR